MGCGLCAVSAVFRWSFTGDRGVSVLAGDAVGERAGGASLLPPATVGYMPTQPNTYLLRQAQVKV